MSDVPICGDCGRPLDRVDHVAIEHLFLDANMFRPVSVDKPLPGEEFGVGSRTELRCGYCQAVLRPEQRRYFYERWYAVLAVTRR